MKLARCLPAVLALAIATPAAVSAQTDVGVRGGYLASSADFEEFASEFRGAAVVGGFASFWMLDFLAIQLEALYATKGFSTVGFQVDGTTARFHYLQVPFVAKLRFIERGPVRPAAMLGVYYAYEIGCETSGQLPEIEGMDSCGGRFRLRGKGDVGFVFGGTVDIAVSRRAFLVLDGRYDFGLRDLHFDPDTERARSRAWSVTGGFGIRVGS